MTLFLNEKDVLSLLTIEEAIEALEGPIREQGLGEASNRPRQIVKIPNASVSVLQAAVPSLKSLGFKTYSVSPEGARFWLMLFNDSGVLQSLMEAENVGMLRTGAATGIATKYLSREDSSTVGLLGTGFQAASQLESLVAVRPIKHVKAWSRTRANVVAFCDRMTKQLGIPVEPAEDARGAVSNVDIVTTITSAKDPILNGDWLREGTHVNLVGAMKPQFREVDTRTLERADKLVVDDWQQAHEEAGEFILAHEEGKLNWDHVTELSTVVAQGLGKRGSDAAITLFKSHGIGLWDIAAAAKIYANAVKRGVGLPLPIEQPPVVLGGGRDPDRIRLAI
jgi:ornithine cyclodeaminase/alanine dehydrogenase-like protein (mu-crystallin family)